LAFAKFLPEAAAQPDDSALNAALKEYKETSARQTTHPGRRATRQTRFLEIVRAL